MNSEQQLEEVEVSITAAKKAIEQRDALLRLTTNNDFKIVIEELYLKDEALRLVNLKSSHTLTKDQKENVDNMMYGIGSLNGFFSNVFSLGSQMEQALADSEAAREDILKEGLE